MKNLLRSKEIGWLSGHQVQGQTVFPAAGYVSTAIEAAKSLVGDETISLIDIQDFVIHQAVAFEQDDAGIEVLISLGEIKKPYQGRIQAKFTYSAAIGSQSNDLDLAASGYIDIHLGNASQALLPQRAPNPAHMIDVDSERFYGALANLGYDFSGRFRSLTTMRRVHHKSVCKVMMMPREAGEESLIVHPAELDAAFQSVILAYSYPDDDQLVSLHLPTQIGRIRVNPALCASKSRDYVDLVPVDAVITPLSFGDQGFSGDVNLFTNDGPNAAIQVQAVKLVPVGGTTVDNDRKVFSKIDWLNRFPDGLAAAIDTNVSQQDRDVLDALERISVFYLAEFDRLVPAKDPIRAERPYSCYLDYARHIISLVRDGKHRLAKKEWLSDSLQDVLAATNKFSDIVDVRMMHLVGKTMPRAFRRETTMLEEFRTSNLLDEYYETGFGLQQSSMWIARAVLLTSSQGPEPVVLRRISSAL
jgi:acyl transferase domain-containing protein